MSTGRRRTVSSFRKRAAASSLAGNRRAPPLPPCKTMVEPSCGSRRSQTACSSGRGCNSPLARPRRMRTSTRASPNGLRRGSSSLGSLTATSHAGISLPTRRSSRASTLPASTAARSRVVPGASTERSSHSGPRTRSRSRSRCSTRHGRAPPPSSSCTTMISPCKSSASRLRGRRSPPSPARASSATSACTESRPSTTVRSSHRRSRPSARCTPMRRSVESRTSYGLTTRWSQWSRRTVTFASCSTRWARARS
mmetsp:Transcript_38642/g.101933  ORF Transcript_38642/g.101933 Transcript_38642/m.101933 type:complete len:253 (+) Transcript_38642:446-1204(+)